MIPSTDADNQSEGSQLSFFHRIKLLLSNPKDALSLFSFNERRGTALIIFLCYFLIKFPFALQRPYLEGKFDDLDGVSLLAFIAGGFAGGMLVTLIVFLLTAWVIHLILNKWKNAGMRFEDAVTVLVLSLAPQLILVFELPFFLADYQKMESFFTVLLLRLIVDLFSLRVFYWGLQVIFNVSATKAIAVIFLPALVLTVLIIKLLII